MAKSYVTTRDIVIPAGTEVGLGPTASTYYTEHGEIIIGFTKDTTGTLRFDLEEGLVNGVIVEAAS